MDKINYRVYRLGGKPVFAVPDYSRDARLAGIARYQPTTFKRSLYRRIMTTAIWAGLDQFFMSAEQNPIVNNRSFDFALWLESVTSVLGTGDFSVAVFWPPQADRGRVYVHLLNHSQEPIGFAKISFDEHNDGCLENEARMLQHLEEAKLTEIRVPKVIDYQPASPSTHAVLLMEPIPAEARPLEKNQASFPEQCVQEFAGTPYPLGAGGCSTLSWWTTYLARNETIDQMFSRELSEANTETAFLCQSHGDFTRANVVRDSNDHLWVFDWEESCQDGPILADEMSFFLGVHRPRKNSDYESLIALFREQFLADNDPQRRIDAMLALAFRLTVAENEADFIISRWKQF